MVLIRDAKEEDLPICEKISKVPELQTPEGDYPNSRYLKAFLNKNFFLIAEVDNEVVGYLAGEVLNGGVIYLNCLVVKKEFRGRSIGKKLLIEFKKRAKEMNLRVILFFAPKANKRTIKFYEKCGFLKGKEYYLFSKNI
jgi:ribosomal protein S18 acetylase RimI-like enzyme